MQKRTSEFFKSTGFSFSMPVPVWLCLLRMTLNILQRISSLGLWNLWYAQSTRTVTLLSRLKPFNPSLILRWILGRLLPILLQIDWIGIGALYSLIRNNLWHFPCSRFRNFGWNEFNYASHRRNWTSHNETWKDFAWRCFHDCWFVASFRFWWKQSLKPVSNCWPINRQPSLQTNTKRSEPCGRNTFPTNWRQKKSPWHFLLPDSDEEKCENIDAEQIVDFMFQEDPEAREDEIRFMRKVSGCDKTKFHAIDFQDANEELDEGMFE